MLQKTEVMEDTLKTLLKTAGTIQNLSLTVTDDRGSSQTLTKTEKR